jgi:V8-like Glu-specific endopeptidase
MKIKTVLVVFFLSCLAISPASAIEKGTVAVSNSIVVHIFAKTGADGTFSSCSGALISPDVVATAVHCLTDSNGQIVSDIRVSPPGWSKPYDASTWTVSLKTWFSADYQGTTASGTVGDSDIAFIELLVPFTQTTPIYFASEGQLLTLKSTQAKLRIIGYGVTSDNSTGTNDTDVPYYYDGQYSRQISADPNAAILESQNSDTCVGDSGAPVLSITPSKILIVGINTGSPRSIKCTKKDSNGLYTAQFTIINHFSNLALAAQVEATAFAEKAALKALDLSNSKNSNLDNANSQLDSLQSDLDDANATIASLKDQIAAFKTLGLKTISCISGVKTKIVAAAKPKCPVGYKVQTQ